MLAFGVKLVKEDITDERDVVKFDEMDRKMRVCETLWLQLARRRRLRVNFDLPMKEQYEVFIMQLLEDSEGRHRTGRGRD